MVTHKPKDIESYYNRGITCYEQREYAKAIAAFSEVIKREPNYAEAYSARGEAWLHLKEWAKAKTDLITAKNMGIDIVTSFHNDYESVENFEQKNNIQLPEDLAAMLRRQ